MLYCVVLLLMGFLSMADNYVKPEQNNTAGQPSGVCPGCGRCNHCGRMPWDSAPLPYNPQPWPRYPSPWCGTTPNTAPNGLWYGSTVVHSNTPNLELGPIAQPCEVQDELER